MQSTRPARLWLDRSFLALCSFQAIFLVSLPLAYGATPFHIKTIASWATLGMAGMGMGLLVLRNPKAGIPLPVASALGLLLGLGWFMTWNARGIWDSGFWEMLPLQQPLPGLPGSIDQPVSTDTMLTLSALSMVLLFVLRLTRNLDRCHRLLALLSLGGLLAVLLGFSQLATGAGDIWWGDRNLGYRFFFGPFRYHGNAGAFINLVWPVTAACFMISWKHRAASSLHHLRCQLWGVGLLAISVGALAHGSRAASAIFFLMLPLWLLSHLGWLRRHFRLKGAAQWFGLVAATMALLAGILAFVLRAGVRWLEILRYPYSLVERWSAYEVGLAAARDAGALGFGPGTFKWAFPNYITEETGRLTGFWRFQHQDYLQTWIEWGWLGTAAWILFALIIAATVARNAWKNPGLWRGRRGLLLRATVLSSLTVMAHSLVDFPQQIFSIQLYFWVLLGCALRLTQIPRSPGIPSSR